MSIVITSASDSKENVIAAMGDLAPKETVEEKKSASTEESEDEITEESDASENDTEENSDDESEDSESDEEKPVKDDGKKPEKKGFRKRIDKLTKRLSAKDQEVEYWKQAALKGQGANQEPKPKETPKVEAVEANGKPNPDDFDSHAAYIEAVADWKYEAKEKERETKARENQVKSDYQKQAEAFQSKVSAFKEAHSDFDDLMEDVEDIPLSGGLQNVIISSKLGPELMYELAKDRKELQRLSNLSVIEAAKEIGVIEARLAKASSPEKTLKTQTKAPPPIKPIHSGKAGTRKSIFDPDISQSEYEKLRREQMSQKA